MTDSPLQISKRAENPSRFLRPAFPFANARTAFKALLLALNLATEDEVLLPAYIGWSKNEGSGVFDPVNEIGARFRFYRLTRQLTLDLDDLRHQLEKSRPRVVVFIHYFGWPDAALTEAVVMAREYGAFVLEDEAHSLYSDWVSGICGRRGDAVIFSLHKLLPFNSGGLLVFNPSVRADLLGAIQKLQLQQSLPGSLIDFDWQGIAQSRQQHAQCIMDLLVPLRGRVDPLWSLSEGVVPQTLPVIVSYGSRDDLYFRMNEAGFGVVTLYHTLVSTIHPEAYPDSHWLAKHIMNLPVHQDATPEGLEDMVNYLTTLVM